MELSRPGLFGTHRKRLAWGGPASYLSAMSVLREIKRRVAASKAVFIEPCSQLVLNDFGKLGRSYLETDEGQADLETIIRSLIVGEYSRPKRVVAFNTLEGWARDVSEDVARDLLSRVDPRDLPDSTLEFVWLHLGERSTAPA